MMSAEKNTEEYSQAFIEPGAYSQKTQSLTT